MPASPLSIALIASIARFYLSALLLVAGLALATGCSRHEDDEGLADASSATPPPAASPAKASPLPTDAGAPARSARADQALLAVADAGRLCGEKGLPDCPMQLWMKGSPSSAIQLREPGELADAFDTMASLVPSRDLAAGGYVNWVSISLDGAAAARIGDIVAAEAACRECHAQYRAKYHAELRALPLPVRAPGARR